MFRFTILLHTGKKTGEGTKDRTFRKAIQASVLYTAINRSKSDSHKRNTLSTIRNQVAVTTQSEVIRAIKRSVYKAMNWWLANTNIYGERFMRWQSNASSRHQKWIFRQKSILLQTPVTPLERLTDNVSFHRCYVKTQIKNDEYDAVKCMMKKVCIIEKC